MLELGVITIRNENSIIQCRNKIRFLAIELNFSYVQATRLATVSSEICWSLLGDEDNSCVTVCFDTLEDRLGLLLIFRDANARFKAAKHEFLFDQFALILDEKGNQDVHAFKYFPDPTFVPSSDFIEVEKSKIIQLSREELMGELEEAIDVAESATKAKGDFLANMSHEIRTPMNAVIGLSDLCLRTELNPKQQDYLSKIHSSAESLLGIINDILDFSKIEAGQLDFEEIEFELDELLENLATVTHIKIQEKGLEFLFNRDPSIPSVLKGDPLRLNQILINLTNNSVKFTDDGEIVIKIELVEKSDESVVLQFSIRDTGIGMNAEQQSRLFQSFSQADSSITRKYGGTGLGLSISKQLVEMMKGEIGVESEPGVGSTFTFTVTLGIGSAAEIKSYDVVPDLKNMRAIVVDDNPTALEILGTYLKHFTFKVDLANNADELFKSIEENPEHYDLIVLDWLMPGMTGLEIAEKIKTEIKPRVDPHIIMVSAFNAGDTTDKPGGEYIDQFLSKPVSPSHLFDAIMAAFGVAINPVKRKLGGQEFDVATLRPVQGAEILLVEDNEINQQVASETLEQAGFYVDIAYHGQEALDMLERKVYDCVLMDIQMPIMDGFTATAKIRENAAYQELPILAMTANATKEDRDSSLAAGMNEHIAKPIRPQLLFKALLEWIPHGDRALPESFASDIDSTVVEPLLPDMPGIDVEGGLERMGGSAKSYIKLIGKFSENQGAAISEIREALTSNDQELAERLAHTLKGVSGSIGATELFKSATELESAIKQQAENEVAELLGKVDVELSRVVELIQRVTESTSTASAQPKKLPEDLEQSLRLLMEKLEDYDSAAEEVLLEILEAVDGTPVHEMLMGIKKQIGKYDMEAAANELQPLIEIILELS